MYADAQTILCVAVRGGLPISPPPGAISNIVPPSNALYGLSEF
jgi:hypothetical protein